MHTFIRQWCTVQELCFLYSLNYCCIAIYSPLFRKEVALLFVFCLLHNPGGNKPVGSPSLRLVILQIYTNRKYLSLAGTIQGVIYRVGYVLDRFHNPYQYRGKSSSLYTGHLIPQVLIVNLKQVTSLFCVSKLILFKREETPRIIFCKKICFVIIICDIKCMSFKSSFSSESRNGDLHFE